MFTRASQIVAYVLKAVADGWGYVLGGNGEPYDAAKAELWAKVRNKPSSWAGTKWGYFVEACARWFGKMVADCSGLIVGAIRSVYPAYGDRSANTFKSQFTESGKIKTIPEIPGLAVWKSGHIGIYVGKGKVVEARGYKYGVVITNLKDRPWTHWGKLRDVEYDTVSVTSGWSCGRVLKLTAPRMTGRDVYDLEMALEAAGFDCGMTKTELRDKIGKFGPMCNEALRAWQGKNPECGTKGKPDGQAGRKTVEKLGGVWRGR